MMLRRFAWSMPAWSYLSSSPEETVKSTRARTIRGATIDPESAMKRFYLAALASLALFSGCQNAEREVPLTSVKTVRFLAGTADTRTAFDEAVNGVYQTRWTANDSDVLLSLNYGKAESSAVTPSADGVTASFEASFDASAATSPYTFYAVSPASAARAISPSRHAWSVSVAAEQKPLATSVDEAAQLLVAKSAASTALPDEVNLHFAHLTAYGRIALKNLELGDAVAYRVELVFSTPVVGEWYWSEDGSLTSNGASHTITLDTDASGDLWFACAPVDVSGKRMELTIFTDLGILTKEITFPEGRKFTSGKVARFSVDMAGIELDGGAGAFVPVTSEEDLSVGSEVILLNASRDRAMGAQNGNYRNAETTGFTLHGKHVTLRGETVAVLTLEAGADAGTWSFKAADGYLAATSGSSNYMLTQADKDKYASWTLTFGSEGEVDIKAPDAGTRNLMRYNPEYPRFSCYKSSTKAELLRIYRKGGGSGESVVDDPLTASSAYGSYLTGAAWTYVKGVDQMVRSYSDGKLEFVLLKASTKEQLVVSGYDPSLAKGRAANVSVRYRKGKDVLLQKEYTLTVVKEDGPKVWLGDGSGQGLILKK